MNANDKVRNIYHHEGDVEESPKILRVSMPAMFEDRCKFVQTPSCGVDHEYNFPPGKLAVVAIDHGHCEKNDEDDELNNFKDIPGSWDDETVLVEYGCLSWVVQRGLTTLVVVVNDVEPCVWRIHYAAYVDCFNDLLTRCRT